MSCCCPHSQSGGRLFSFMAKSYRRRFAKKGFEPSQVQLMEGLNKAGYVDATILEIGSGVGYLHQTLIEHGAKSAVGIELSAEMIVQAKDWAKEKGLEEKTEYFVGDFVELLDQIKPANVTILDKVVCCYPDAKLMVESSLSKTTQVYALTYPRDLWFIKAAIGILAIILKLMGSSFRPYVHDPDEIEKWVIDSGYEKIYQKQTFIWLSQVYKK